MSSVDQPPSVRRCVCVCVLCIGLSVCRSVYIGIAGKLHTLAPSVGDERLNAL